MRSFSFSFRRILAHGTLSSTPLATGCESYSNQYQLRPCSQITLCLPPGSHHVLVIVFFCCDSCGFPLRTEVRCPNLDGRVAFSLGRNTTPDSVASPPSRDPCTSAHSTLIPGRFTRVLRPARATRCTVQQSTRWPLASVVSCAANMNVTTSAESTVVVETEGVLCVPLSSTV